MPPTTTTTITTITTTPILLRYAAPTIILLHASLLTHTTTLTTTLLPPLLLSPATLLLRQWHLANAKALPVAVCLTTLSTYLSYHLYTSIAALPTPGAAAALGKWRAKWLLASALVPLLQIPWSVFVMGAVEGLLASRAKQVGLLEEGEALKVDGTDVVALGERMGIDEVVRVAVGGREEREGLSSHQLVDVWGVLNLGRAMIVAIAGGCALWGVVGL